MRRRGGQGGEEAWREGDWDCRRRGGGRGKPSCLLRELERAEALGKLMLQPSHFEGVPGINDPSTTGEDCETIILHLIELLCLGKRPDLVGLVPSQFLCHLWGINVKYSLITK